MKMLVALAALSSVQAFQLYSSSPARASVAMCGRKKKTAIVSPDGKSVIDPFSAADKRRQEKLATLLVDLQAAATVDTLDSAIKACEEFGLEPNNPAIESAAARRESLLKDEDAPAEDAQQPPVAVEEELAAPIEEEEEVEEEVAEPVAEEEEEVEEEVAEPVAEEEEVAVGEVEEPVEEEDEKPTEPAVEEEEEEDPKIPEALAGMESAETLEAFNAAFDDDVALPEDLVSKKSLFESAESAKSAEDLADLGDISPFYAKRLEAWQSLDEKIGGTDLDALDAALEAAEAAGVPGTEEARQARESLSQRFADLEAATAGSSIEAIDAAIEGFPESFVDAALAKRAVLSSLESFPPDLSALREAMDVAARLGVQDEDAAFTAFARAERIAGLFQEGMSRVEAREARAKEFEDYLSKIEKAEADRISGLYDEGLARLEARQARAKEFEEYVAGLEKARADRIASLYEEGLATIEQRRSRNAEFEEMRGRQRIESLENQGRQVIARREATRKQYEDYLERQRELSVLSAWGTDDGQVFFQLQDDGVALVSPSIGESGTWETVETLSSYSTRIQVSVKLGHFPPKPFVLTGIVSGNTLDLDTKKVSFLGTPIEETGQVAQLIKLD